MPELVLTRRAQDLVASLPPTVQAEVLDALGLIAVDPRTAGKRLQGRLSGIWSARVGDYRVLYSIEGSGRVVVQSVRNRAEAYLTKRERRRLPPS